MGWIPVDLVTTGGPWVLLLALMIALVWLKLTGAILSAGEVERTIAGYRDSLDRTEKDRDYWRTACSAKDQTIATQADQLQKMTSYAALGTHALEDIVKEARRRVDQDA